MNRRVMRQAVVGSILGALLGVALLLGDLLVLASIAGTHPSQTGMMLIASPSQLAHGLRNEFTASKLYSMDSYHKPFRHYC